MNVLVDRGPNLDDDFWDDLEETLILADMGGSAASQVVENLRDEATRKALPDAYAVLDRLNDELASTFATAEADPFGGDPACVLFVGINGAGKTTTVGKLAKEGADAGRKVILGFRRHVPRCGYRTAQEEWSRPRERSHRGTRARKRPGKRVLRHHRTRRGRWLRFGTHRHGRTPHTSDDLMRELQKVVNVVRKRSKAPRVHRARD